MTIGFVTLLVPAIQGGDGRHTSKNEFTLSEDDISLISKCFFYRNSVKSVLLWLIMYSCYILRSTGMV